MAALAPPRSVWMTGPATWTIVASRRFMASATSTAARASHRHRYAGADTAAPGTDSGAGAWRGSTGVLRCVVRDMFLSPYGVRDGGPPGEAAGEAPGEAAGAHRAATSAATSIFGAGIS